MAWTIQEGIIFCRQVQPIAMAYGWHVALGGSVLIRNSSEKDLDVFLYEHTPKKDEEIDIAYPDVVVSRLSSLIGLRPLDDKAKSPSDEVYKTIYRCTYHQKRIDFIFLNNLKKYADNT